MWRKSASTTMAAGFRLYASSLLVLGLSCGAWSHEQHRAPDTSLAWLERAQHGAWRMLQQMTSGTPTPFPEPDVAAGSPYTNNQQMVLNTTQSPFWAIGQLIIWWGPPNANFQNSGFCTGSLVSAL